MRKSPVRVSLPSGFAAETGPTRRYSLMVGDALSLPFPDDSFDRLICSEVLEHIPDYQAAMTEIWRVVKPGGRIGISVPHGWPEHLLDAVEAWLQHAGRHADIQTRCFAPRV